MDRRLLSYSAAGWLILAACGGKCDRAPVRLQPIADATPAVGAAPPSNHDALAPAPRITVGLETGAKAVRLSSSAPFRLGAGRSWIETHDVLVELEAGASADGWVYRVQLGTFPDESSAAAFRDRLAAELDENPTVGRELGTGRFGVRIGELATEAAAETLRRDLARLELEALEIVREPASAPTPQGLLMTPHGGPTLRTTELALEAVPRGRGYFVEVDGKPYRGYVTVRVNAANLLTVANVVALEEYLRGVVPAELSPAVFPEKEALKAQAIAARTYAVKRAGQFASEGYDICATPACQVYRGVSVEHPLSDDAVAETRGEVLTYDGELVDALYTSTCGGRTEDAENVFSTPEPYLVSRMCFTERGASVLRSTAPAPLSLAAAVLTRLGIVQGLPAENVPLTEATARRWLVATLEHLGQSACWEERGGGDAAVSLAAFAGFLGEALCWDRRLPFLVSPLDAARVVEGEGLSDTDHRNLANALREGLLVPPPDGLEPGAALRRDDVLEALFRLLESRGEPPLRPGRILAVEGDRLRLRDEALGDDENEISTALASTRYLYGSASGRTFYAPRLTILPSDAVRFHVGDGGVDLLVLDSGGGSFDRTSRFSHWVVRRTNDDLSWELNARHGIGRVRELRPKRYGRSGRLAELEVVGTHGTVTLEGLAIRRGLGIRENLFFFDAQRAADGDVRSWVFTGRGWGHGVGLCQVGAYGMAAAGYDYRQILAHYYAGTRVVPRSSIASR